MSNIKEKSDKMSSDYKKLGLISLAVFVISTFIFICFSIKTDTTVDDYIFGPLAFLSFVLAGEGLLNTEGKTAEEKVMYKASKKNPDMEYNDFLYEYSGEIDTEQERMDRQKEEAEERRRQQEIIRKAEMKEQRERLERQHNFDIAKQKYVSAQNQLHAHVSYDADLSAKRMMAEAEADMHKYSN